MALVAQVEDGCKFWLAAKDNARVVHVVMSNAIPVVAQWIALEPSSIFGIS